MTLTDIFGIYEGKPLFQVIFLKNDSDQSIWIDEVKEINFSEIRKHLEHGESIFIASNENSKLLTCRTSDKAIKKNPIHSNEKIRESSLESESIILLSSIVNTMQSHKFGSYGHESARALVVLDTVESLFAGLANEGILRAELRRLFRWLKDKGITAIITAEQGRGTLTRYGLEEINCCVCQSQEDL